MAGIPGIGPLIEKMEKSYKEGKEKQGIAVRVAMEAVCRGVPQGAALGTFSYMMSKALFDNKTVNASMSPADRRQAEQAMAMQPKSIPAAMLAFSALFAVQFGLAEAFRHYRKERDAWNTVVPAAGGGAAFALAQGQPSQVVSMAVGFAGFTFLFEKLGFNKDEDTVKAKDTPYMQSKAMLTELGLAKYHNNVKNGLLTDDTIMLWTDAALADCKIPPGPRLLILYHLKQVSKKQQKSTSSVPPLPPRATDAAPQPKR